MTIDNVYKPNHTALIHFLMILTLRYAVRLRQRANVPHSSGARPWWLAPLGSKSSMGPLVPCMEALQGSAAPQSTDLRVSFVFVLV